MYSLACCRFQMKIYSHSYHDQQVNNLAYHRIAHDKLNKTHNMFVVHVQYRSTLIDFNKEKLNSHLYHLDMEETKLEINTIFDEENYVRDQFVVEYVLLVNHS
jgi:hypothetical protein